jgi:hypothetical protein
MQVLCTRSLLQILCKRHIVTGEFKNFKSCYEMRGLTEMSNLDYDERCGTVGRFYEKLQVTKTTEQQNS